MCPQDPTPSPSPRPEQARSNAPPRIPSHSLLGEHDEVEIEHEGQLYRLRRTALGKLILTK